MMTVIPLLIAAFVKMTPLETFHDGTNDTLTAAKAYTDLHRSVDTNAVRNLINASFDGGTQNVNRVTASFDGLGNRVTDIERELPGISNRVDTLETATDTLQTTVTSHTSQLSQLSQSVATKQAKLSDYTTTNAVKSLIESKVGGTSTLVHRADMPGYVESHSLTNAGALVAATNAAKAYTDAKIGDVKSDRITTTWATNGVSTIHADGRWMTRTNATAGVAMTNTLCTVAAAQAMTNDPKIVRGNFSSDTWDIVVSTSRYADEALHAQFAYGVMWENVEGKPGLYTKSQIDGTSVTNLGAVAMATNAAKSYADSTFLKTNNKIHWGQNGVIFDQGCEIIAHDYILLDRWDYLGVGSMFLPQYLSGGDWNTATGTNKFAKIGDIPPAVTDAHIGTIATNVVTPVAQTVSDWETYWRGDRVRLSVTNYYGNTSGEPPLLRIEEFDHSVTNNGVVSNFYHVVWDETTRQTNYMAVTDAKVDAISNTVMDAAWKQTNLQLINKAPRAWQNVTSAGEDAPPNTVWHTAPQTVFAGGTEYAHVAVGEGTIAVLVDKGAPVFTEGAEGQFRFQDQSGQNYFGFDVLSSYKLGCNTDGISVNQTTHTVSLTYDLTSSTNPSILHSTNLVDWADAVVEWETNPPAGTKICYINCGNDPKGFYQAELRYAGGSKFLTNMQADLKGGIAASNQTLNVIQSVEPYIVNGQVLWRVKQ